MSLSQRQFVHRLGITAMNITLIVAGIILLGTFGWLGWNYYSNPETKLENINGNIVRTTLNPTVRGFFDQASFNWRSAEASAMAAGETTIEKYASELPLGPMEGTVFSDQVVAEPVPVTVDENVNVSADTNLNANENTNIDLNANENLNLNENVNADMNANLNTNQDVNSNLNVNEDINADQNVNVDVNQNANIDINQNTNANENVNVPVNENLNINTNLNANENANSNINLNVNQNRNTNAAVNTNLNQNTNQPTNQNATVATSEKPEVITGDDWRRQVPRGRGFLQANWFCSAAYTHLSLIKTDGSELKLGDFTGDCTNPAVVVKGYFLPQELVGVDLSQPLNFRIATEWYDGTRTKDTATDSQLCVVDYIRGAGHRDVYAAQYTCDDGLGIGSGNDDLQFTVYAFPSAWTFPKDQAGLFNAADLKSDDDGDGLNLQRELKLGTNPNHWDSDIDNLGDYEEVEKYETDPLQADTDGDGYKDYIEVNGGYNPLGSGLATAEQLAAWAAAPNQPGKPVITNVTAEYVSGVIAVSWDVTPAADGIVNYGLTDGYGTYQNNKNFLNRHSISIPGQPGQSVHYAIRSCTTAPNSACATTNDAVFEVPAE